MGVLAQGIASVVDGLEHETSSVVVYVCFRIREAIPFSLEKKDRIYLTGMPAWRRNWRAFVTA